MSNKWLAMAQNKVQFQKGLSLPAFLKLYGTEDQCYKALFDWRGPEGLSVMLAEALKAAN